MIEYGLIGFPLSHSFSKKYFAEKFEKESILECSYELFPLENIDQLPFLLKQHSNLRGLNVTIPYKQQVLHFLDVLTPVVEEIQACNCIKIQDGKLVGYNTDVIGFEQTLERKLAAHHKQALVLGTGGAAKAVQYVLKKKGINYLQVSRTKRNGIISYAELNQEILETHTLVINTSPLGMYPAVEEAPEIPYNCLSERHYLYDLVYNPVKTRFLAEGERRGAVIENGADMLVIQAEASWDIWNTA